MALVPLTDTEKTDTRRFCGFPAYGYGPTDATFNRFSVAYGMLEYRVSALSEAELAVVRVKLVELNALDAAVATSGSRLSTESAAVWKRNENEVRDRNGLFKMRCRELVAFLGVGYGPGLSGGANNIALVI
jgi:hypothetical protein